MAAANTLKRRGSLTIWFDPAMTWEAAPTGKRGRQPDCGDAAIRICLTMKVPFGMAPRQTTGFAESLLRLTGLDRAVPDFSTPSRRQKTLKVDIPCRGSRGLPHLPIDSTGIRVDGEGEWKARRHGGTKRRVWRRIHIGIDEQTLEIRAAALTTGDVGDVEPASATGFERTGEGCCPICSTRSHPISRSPGSLPTAPSTPATCHDAIAARGAAAIIPPRKNSRP